MDIQLKVDGRPVETTAMKIEVNGRTYPFDRITELNDEWLFILDAATVHIQQSAPFEKGASYDIEFELGLHIPYILVGGAGKPLLASTKVVKTLVCR